MPSTSSCHSSISTRTGRIQTITAHPNSKLIRRAPALADPAPSSHGPTCELQSHPLPAFSRIGLCFSKAWDLTRSGFLKTRTPQRSSPHISTCFTAAGFRGLVGRGCIQTMGEGEDELGRRSENWRNCFCHLLPPKHPKVPNTSQARKDHAVALLHQRCHQQGKDRSPFI